MNTNSKKGSTRLVSGAEQSNMSTSGAFSNLTGDVDTGENQDAGKIDILEEILTILLNTILRRFSKELIPPTFFKYVFNGVSELFKPDISKCIEHVENYLIEPDSTQESSLESMVQSDFGSVISSAYNTTLYGTGDEEWNVRSRKTVCVRFMKVHLVLKKFISDVINLVQHPPYKDVHIILRIDQVKEASATRVIDVVISNMQLLQNFANADFQKLALIDILCNFANALTHHVEEGIRYTLRGQICREASSSALPQRTLYEIKEGFSIKLYTASISR